MTRHLAMGAVLALVALVPPAVAAEPRLFVYVTDADEDVYVALYGDVAVELAACGGEQEARALLQLPAAATAVETTLANLQARFAFGTHPRIPCGPLATFDADWPATTPIWADLDGSGNYFLPASSGGGSFYAVPSRCTGIKTALAIRQRLQLPGVLQDLAAPAGLSVRLVLDCGDASEVPDLGEPPSATPALSLHKFETFLSAESTGDTIYVVRFRPSAKDATPVYLPIWRVNGRPVSEIILVGGDAASATETALAGLFGLPAAAPVTQLGAEAVPAVRAAVHADLCLASCDRYVHHHAAFASPGLDLGLTELAAGTLSRRRGRLGEEQLVWTFLGGREAVFTTCGRLAAALGLAVPAEGDWLAAVEAGLLAQPGQASGFVCQEGAAATCVRRIADGAPLTQAAFAPGADCAGARRLRVELPAAAPVAAPLLLSGTSFDSVELAPRSGVSRSVLTATLGPPVASAASCLLSAAAPLVLADHLPLLLIHDSSLRWAAAGSGGAEVVGLQVQNGSLSLEGVVLGGDAEGTRPLARGVTLCAADLYAAGSEINAGSLGVQGISARILFAGTAAAPASIRQPRFGLLLSADSVARLDHARIVARTPLVLRGGRAVATRNELSPTTGAASDSTALSLERGASAAFTTSTVAGFRCVASFTDAASAATFVLPGNDLARDNTHLACGAPGQLTVRE